MNSGQNCKMLSLMNKSIKIQLRFNIVTKIKWSLECKSISCRFLLCFFFQSFWMLNKLCLVYIANYTTKCVDTRDKLNVFIFLELPTL